MAKNWKVAKKIGKWPKKWKVARKLGQFLETGIRFLEIGIFQIWKVAKKWKVAKNLEIGLETGNILGNCVSFWKLEFVFWKLEYSKFGKWTKLESGQKFGNWELETGSEIE